MDRSGKAGGPGLKLASRFWKIATATFVVATVSFFLLPVVTPEAPTASVMWGRDGTLLSATISEDEQWRFPPQSQLPEKYRIALLAFEDRRFRWHPGVDPLAVARAAWTNVRAGRIVSGASTLTMQVIRMARRDQPRTFMEKLREAMLALRLEWATSKEDILELYANHAPFGGNVVGLQAAAWMYFQRSAHELTWAEASTLAVLPNRPGLVHPGSDRTQLRAKRDQLLRRLAKRKMLNDLDLQTALRETLVRGPQSLPKKASHLLMTLTARHGPNSYHTTLDATLQRKVSQDVQHTRTRLEAKGVHNTAVVVFEVATGSLLAYIGNSRPLTSKEHASNVDITRAQRSAGSTLKPFLYAAMVDAGELLPHALVADIPTRLGGFAPKNFDRNYHGAVPASQALAKSLNVPAVRLLQAFGVARFHHFLRRIGMSSLKRSADWYGLALILGGAEVTLYELTALYAKLARVAQGNGPTPWTPQVLSDAPAKSSGPRPWPISSGAAYLTVNALLDVQRPGVDNVWKSFASSQKIAWKTGTSYGFRDAWAIGVTPKFAVGVWAGNADGEGRAGLTGRSAAAPLLFTIFRHLPTGAGFEPPRSGLKSVRVCRNSGMLAGPHCASTRSESIPRETQPETPCPFCTTVVCNVDCTERLHRDCAAADEIHHARLFVLPPNLEWFYRRRHALYRSLPPPRPGCGAALDRATSPLGCIFPREGSRLYVPRDVSGDRSQAVFEATHRDPNARVYWHLNDVYLGSTKTLHQMASAPPPGRHTLTLVDEAGATLSRRFEVLAHPAKNAARASPSGAKVSAGRTSASHLLGRVKTER